MAELVIFDLDEAKEEVYTITLDMPPYNGATEIDVRPKTRAMIVEARRLAKQNPIYNRHTILVEDGKGGTKRKTVEGQPDEAFTQELLDLLIVDWRGVRSRNGQQVPCTRETKILLGQNVDVANYLILRAGEVAVTSAEADEKNSES